MSSCNKACTSSSYSVSSILLQNNLVSFLLGCIQDKMKMLLHSLISLDYFLKCLGKSHRRLEVYCKMTHNIIVFTPCNTFRGKTYCITQFVYGPCNNIAGHLYHLIKFGGME